MKVKDFLDICNSITDSDRVKFERYYNDVLVPIIKRVAEGRGRELKIYNGSNSVDYCKIGIEIFGDKMTKGYRVIQMKPFLEEKGFKVSVSSPDYYTYLRF